MALETAISKHGPLLWGPRMALERRLDVTSNTFSDIRSHWQYKHYLGKLLPKMASLALSL